MNIQVAKGGKKQSLVETYIHKDWVKVFMAAQEIYESQIYM